MAEEVPRRCQGCGWPIITEVAYRRNPALRSTNRPHGGYGMCRTCCGRARYAGTLPNPAPPKRRGDHALDPCVERLAGASVRLGAEVERRAALAVCHLSGGDIQDAAIVLAALGLLPADIEGMRSA